MFETVIWMTDGSPAADRALPYAKALLADGGTLVAVHAEERFVGRTSHHPVRADENELEAKIREQVAEARAEGFDVSLRIVAAIGPAAAHMAVDVAREVDADAIVVGTRGHTLVAGLLIGSATQQLLQVAPCPVLVVPPRAAAVDEEPVPLVAEAAH